MPSTAKTCRTRFSEITQGCELFSVNAGVPAEQALHRAGHLLDSVAAELAQAAMGEPMTPGRAFLLMNAASAAHAIVVGCAEGMAE